MACAVAGAFASIRNDEEGLGAEFLAGLHAIGYCFIPVSGVMVLLITNVVPLLLGTFAETCSLNLPQKGRKAGHDCLWAVA